MFLTKAEWDALSTENKKLYKQDGDGYRLIEKAGGDDKEQIIKDLKDKVKEFRGTNTDLMKKVDAMEAKYGDLDLDAIKDMKAKLQEMDDKKLIDEGKLDELLEQRTDRMKKDFEAQTTKMANTIDELTGNNTTLTGKLEKVLIDTEIQKAVTSIGVLKAGAMDDVLSRAGRTWKLIDGVPVPMKDDEKIYGKDGKAVMTFDEWAVDLMNVAPHFFEDSSGGGSGDAKGKKGGGSSGSISRIDRSDKTAFGDNLEKIASGEVVAE